MFSNTLRRYRPRIGPEFMIAQIVGGVWRFGLIKVPVSRHDAGQEAADVIEPRPTEPILETH